MTTPIYIINGYETGDPDNPWVYKVHRGYQTRTVGMYDMDIVMFRTDDYNDAERIIQALTRRDQPTPEQLEISDICERLAAIEQAITVPAVTTSLDFSELMSLDDDEPEAELAQQAAFDAYYHDGHEVI